MSSDKFTNESSQTTSISGQSQVTTPLPPTWKESITAAPTGKEAKAHHDCEAEKLTRFVWKWNIYVRNQLAHKIWDKSEAQHRTEGKVIL